MRYIDSKILLNIPLFEESVYNHYLNIKINYLPMKLQSPFYYDKNPSFNLYYHSMNNKIIFKDFKHNWCGDCFNFVMKLFKISYKESVYKIAKDLNLLHLYDAGILEEIGDYSSERQVFSTNKKTNYSYTYKLYTKYELNYWQNYGLITKEMLLDNNVYSANKVYLIKEGNVFVNLYNYSYLLDVRNKNKCCLSKEFTEDMKKANLCFVYDFDKDYNLYGEEKIKIYRPYCNKDKWRGNCNTKTISGLKQLTYDRNKILFIAKAKKEELALKSLQPFIDIQYDVISTINEGTWFVNKDWEYLKQYYDKIILWFDNDTTGINTAYRYSQKYNIHNLIFDNPYKNITDLYQGELIKNNRYVATNETINLIKYYLNDSKF